VQTNRLINLSCAHPGSSRSGRRVPEPGGYMKTPRCDGTWTDRGPTIPVGRSGGRRQRGHPEVTVTGDGWIAVSRPPLTSRSTETDRDLQDVARRTPVDPAQHPPDPWRRCTGAASDPIAAPRSRAKPPPCRVEGTTHHPPHRVRPDIRAAVP
jgi:hypothetical protein